MSDTNHTRRRVAALVGTTVAVSLAGCSTVPGGGSDDDSDDSMDEGMDDEATTEDAMGTETMDDGMGDETPTDDEMDDDG